MNTILKSFLFNFLPPGPLYLICGIFEKTAHLDVQRADDLSERLKKKDGEKKLCVETALQICTDNRVKRNRQFLSAHRHSAALRQELPRR